MLLSFMSCEYEAVKADAAPVIYISKMIDTAYLNTQYNSETVGVEPCEGVIVTGKVNTSKSGTYYLDYDYTDKFGNISATVTRTVYVMENPAAFLNGTYSAVCTCSILKDNSATLVTTASVTTKNYTASVSTSPVRDCFELVNLNIGSSNVIPITSLNGNSIKVNYYRNGGSSGSGTLSPAKNSFTIESVVNEPTIKYLCKNIFTKIDPKQEIRVVN